jgi:hypothetical protein
MKEAGFACDFSDDEARSESIQERWLRWTLAQRSILLNGTTGDLYERATMEGEARRRGWSPKFVAV